MWIYLQKLPFTIFIDCKEVFHSSSFIVLKSEKVSYMYR